MSEVRGSLTRNLFLGFALLIGLIIISSLVGVAITIIFYGMDGLAGMTNPDDPKGLAGMKIIQMAYGLGGFGFAGLLAMKFAHLQPLETLKKTGTLPSLLIAGFVALTALPLVSFTGYLNSQLVLPDFLSGLQDWIEAREEVSQGLILQFLQQSEPIDLVINLVMIAIIPAIGEELFFRGFLQRVFQSRYSAHVSIWLAAAIFSAIHLQFLGFVPRMLLGALFGYLVFWSGSVWPAIVAHAINNGTAVVISYMYGPEMVEGDFEPEISFFFLGGVTLSLALTVGLLSIYKKREAK
jgi:membrane protease YdiL (CAAX protease family)